MSTALDQTALVGLRAAIQSGAGPTEALAATCGDGVLGPAARQARLGRSLTDIAAEGRTGDAAADFLIRCLALAERLGAGATAAVEQALTTIADERRLGRLLEVHAAQAQGTAVFLAVIPLGAWALLVFADPAVLSFYTTPFGWVSGALAVGLAGASWRWMQRLVRSAAGAAASADPLQPPPLARPWRRASVWAFVAAVAVAPALGAVAAVAAAAAVAALVLRHRAAVAPDGTGAAETVLLVAVALEAGMGALAALEEVATVAPDAARPILRTSATRMAGGDSAHQALADTPLAALGATLTATHHWGAPAAPALRALAQQLRDDRRAAAEVAGERLQLTLVFPTTLLTLPAFVLGVVPPLLWSTLRP